MVRFLFKIEWFWVVPAGRMWELSAISHRLLFVSSVLWRIEVSSFVCSRVKWLSLSHCFNPSCVLYVFKKYKKLTHNGSAMFVCQNISSQNLMTAFWWIFVLVVKTKSCEVNLILSLIGSPIHPTMQEVQIDCYRIFQNLFIIHNINYRSHSDLQIWFWNIFSIF